LQIFLSNIIFAFLLKLHNQAIFKDFTQNSAKVLLKVFEEKKS